VGVLKARYRARIKDNKVIDIKEKRKEDGRNRNGIGTLLRRNRKVNVRLKQK
jgi:hypothetical protein